MDRVYKILIALAMCLVLQVAAMAEDDPDYMNMKITIRNELTGLKRSELVYRCHSKSKDYGWRRSAQPGTQFSFEIVVEKEEMNIPAVHHCHFRSACGSVDLTIYNTFLNAEKCPGTVCSHVATPEGIKFRGLDWDFRTVFPTLRPVEYLLLPWKPWPHHDQRLPTPAAWGGGWTKGGKAKIQRSKQ